MKQVLLALGIAFAMPVAAQHYDHSFKYTVFDNYRHLGTANKKASAVTEEKVRANFPGWNVATDKLSAAFRNIYGDAIVIPGATLNDKVAYCMDNKLSALEVVKGEWKQTRNDVAAHASYVDYARYINDHKVVFSNLSFRFTTDGRLVRVKMAHYGNKMYQGGFTSDATSISRVAALNEEMVNAGITVKTKDIKADWVWFPIPTDKGYDLHPSWEFYVTGTANDGFPVELRGYIDATDGKLLYQSNEVSEAFDVKVVSDSIYKTDRVNPVSTLGLPNLRVTIGSNNYFADDTGLISISSLNPPQNVKFDLRGRWSVVRQGGSSGSTPTFSQTVAANGTTFVFPATGTSSIRHVNAYYHTTIAHNFMKSYFPAFTKLDVELSTNVDVAGTCNAFYSGGGGNNISINFFPTGGGCNSFAEIADVVYHEYGHGISYQFYDDKGVNFNNGSLGEGNSDVWAFSITRDSILGRYRTVGNPASFIRRYDAAPKVYPVDVNGEVHNDGEIIAGAWWDVGKNIGSIPVMTDLFTKTYFDLPNAPNGAEGDLYYDILISAILNDDNDAVLSNGTPNLEAIVKGFARHGIYLMTGATLTHQEIPHQAISGQPITVNATLAVSDASFFQSMKLIYRVRGGQWDSTDMTNTGNFNFTGQLPGFNTLSIVDYYFKVYDVLNNSTYGFPNGYNTTMTPMQVTIPYQFAVGAKQNSKTDFDGSIADWTLGDPADNATQGKWVQGVPIATMYNSLIAQPGNDHTTGSGQCLVTGNGPTNYNSADVDNGKTTAISPIYDISTYVFPVIEYYRWYSNDRGSNARSDFWQVQMRDPSSPFWQTIEQTYQSDYNWRRRVFNVREYLSTATQVQLRFIANDALIGSLQNDGQSCIEAAVDDVALYDIADVSVEKMASSSMVNVYPNPANDKLHIAIPASAAGTISLVDITGRKLSVEAVKAGTQQYSINTMGITTGQYLLSIQTDKVSEVKKVVISH
jgi:hypothetical protein